MGGAWAGPDVMAFWPDGRDTPELVRAKKVLAVRLGGWPAYRHFAGKVENFN